DALDGPANVMLVTGAAGEHQGIDDDVLWRNAELRREHLDGSLRDRELSLAAECLGLLWILVDRGDDDRGAVSACERAYALELQLAVFEADRVDEALARTPGQRAFNGRRIGRFDHDGHSDLRHQPRVEGVDVVDLVAVRRLEADVHDLRSM